MSSQRLVPLLALLLALPFSASAEDPKEVPVKPPKPLYRDDFKLTGNAFDPLDPKNPCFEIGNLEIPFEKLPHGRELVLKMLVYCEVWGRPPEWDSGMPGMLQLDVISKKGNRSISQCKFATGKKWVSTELRFTVSPSTRSLELYNKWTEEPIYVDQVTIHLAPDKEEE